MYIRRKYGLGIIVYQNRRVRPPKKSLRQGRPVIELPRDLNICLARVQGYPGDTFCPVHLIHIMTQHGSAAVPGVLNFKIHRQKSGGSVMLWPVKLNAAGNPRSCKPHQRRFDHLIIIHKVVSVCLIVSPLNSSSQFRQNHNLQIFVLQIHRRIFPVRFSVADLLHRWIRIDLAAAPLINPLIQKYRIFFRFPNLIGGNGNLLNPYFCLAHF